MARIGDVPEIKAVKRTLEDLAEHGLVAHWELPYENLLTRLEAAHFFLQATSPDCEPQIWRALAAHGEVVSEVNTLKQLSSLAIGFAFTGPPGALPATQSHAIPERS